MKADIAVVPVMHDTMDESKRKTNDAMDTALFGKDQPGDHDKSNGNPKSR